MIRKTDVIERLNSLIGQELTSDRLHEAIFCEEKHQKILRRYHTGKYTYVQFKIHTNNDGQSFVDIIIPGNPNTFRVDAAEMDGKMIIQSEARINYSYL